MKRNYKDIYEMFSVKNNYDLYNLVKQNPGEFKFLTDAFNFYTTHKNINEEISNCQFLLNYIRKLDIPQKNEAWLLFVNNHLQPVHFSKINFNLADEVKFETINALRSSANQYFLYFNKTESRNSKIKNLEYNFKLLNIELLEKAEFREYINDNKIYFYKQGSEHSLNYTSNKINGIYNINNADYISIPKYDEFISFYAQQELIGLHINRDEEQIKKLIKVGFENQTQENFGYMAYDKNGIIYDTAVLFKGTSNSSPIDSKKIITAIHDYNTLSGIAIYHNHPSGIVNPSDEDINLTNRLFSISEFFDFELWNHYIVGKDGVFSFADNTQNALIDTSIFAKNNNVIKENKPSFSLKTLNQKPQEKKDTITNVIKNSR